MPRLIAALRRCDLTADGTKFLSLKNYLSVNLYREKPDFPVFCEKVVTLQIKDCFCAVFQFRIQTLPKTEVVTYMYKK